MSKELLFGILIALVVFGILLGLAQPVLTRVHLRPDDIQLADAFMGLLTAAFAGLTWWHQLRASRLANAPIALKVRHGREVCELPFRPRRADCGSRAEIAGLLGAFNRDRLQLGSAVLRAMDTPAYRAMMAGRTNELIIDLDDDASFASLRDGIRWF